MKFKYILARVGNKFSRQIYLQTKHISEGTNQFLKKVVENGPRKKK